MKKKIFSNSHKAITFSDLIRLHLSNNTSIELPNITCITLYTLSLSLHTFHSANDDHDDDGDVIKFAR